MRLLLVTGAGATRRLGDEGQMPLMPDWSDALCEALDEQEADLARACHLSPGMDAQEFEKNLGLLLRWNQVRDLEERFQELGGPTPMSHFNEVDRARDQMNKRMDTIVTTINSTLYDQFGQGRVNDDRAASAYGNLLRELGDPDLVLATTNYDRAGEAGVAALGREVDTGFSAGMGRTPTLQPVGLVERRGSLTPVLHLHGAVGWYERSGEVEDHYADQPYNPSLGTPVVLYPDPDKDPTSDALVSQLWNEFHFALTDSDFVLVIGHSLNDPALVRSLKEVSQLKNVGITHFSDGGASRIKKLIPAATPIQMDFGPELETDRRTLKGLLK